METRKCKVGTQVFSTDENGKMVYKTVEEDAVFHGWTMESFSSDSGSYYSTQAIVEMVEDGRVRIIDPTRVRFVG